MVSRKKPCWEVGRHDKKDIGDAPKDIIDVEHVNIKNLVIGAIDRNIDDYIDVVEEGNVDIKSLVIGAIERNIGDYMDVRNKKRVSFENEVIDAVKEDIGDHMDIVDKKHVNIENSVVGVAKETRVLNAWETVTDKDQQSASRSSGSNGEGSIFVTDQNGRYLHGCGRQELQTC